MRLTDLNAALAVGTQSSIAHWARLYPVVMLTDMVSVCQGGVCFIGDNPPEND
jgi:hypothetical protein